MPYWGEEEEEVEALAAAFHVGPAGPSLHSAAWLGWGGEERPGRGHAVPSRLPLAWRSRHQGWPLGTTACPPPASRNSRPHPAPAPLAPPAQEACGLGGDASPAKATKRKAEAAPVDEEALAQLDIEVRLCLPLCSCCFFFGSLLLQLPPVVRACLALPVVGGPGGCSLARVRSPRRAPVVALHCAGSAPAASPLLTELTAWRSGWFGWPCAGAGGQGHPGEVHQRPAQVVAARQGERGS